MPQIQSAALIQTLPGNMDGRSNGDYIITGQTMDGMTVNAPQAGFSVVSGAYFKTVGVPLLAGRTFTECGHPTAPLVAIINAQLARHSFPKIDPIGQKILCGLDLVSMKWMRIVGVVGDARMDGPKQGPMPEIYMPYTQHPRRQFEVFVKTGPHPLTFAQPCGPR